MVDINFDPYVPRRAYNLTKLDAADADKKFGEAFLARRLYNHQKWFGAFHQTVEEGREFPYEIKQISLVPPNPSNPTDQQKAARKKRVAARQKKVNQNVGSIDEKGDVHPTSQCTTFPTIERSNNRKPIYQVMVPYFPASTDSKKIEGIIKAFKEQAFDLTNDMSAKVRNRLAIVVGVNRYESIDGNANEAFRKLIKEVSLIYGISYRVIGFQWKPNWEMKSNLKRFPARSFDENPIFDRQKAYILVKAFSERFAKQIRLENEGESIFANDSHDKMLSAMREQVPFKRFRDHILYSSASDAFFRNIKSHQGSNPFFLGSMDGDFHNLRGTLTSYDAVVGKRQEANEDLPSAMSTGYQAASNAERKYKIPMAMDMVTRESMNKFLNLASYLPEPNIFINCADVSNVRKLSFQARTKVKFDLAKNLGECGLESRRFIENAITQGKIDPSKILFVNARSPETRIQEKMKLGGIADITDFTPQNIHEQNSLRAIFNFSQSHAQEREWCNEISLALKGSLRKGSSQEMYKVLKPLYNSFDSYSLINAYAGFSLEVYSRGIFDDLLRISESYYSKMFQALKDKKGRSMKGLISTNWSRSVSTDRAKQLSYKDFFEALFEKGMGTINELNNRGLSMHLQKRIIQAAHASGKATMGILKNIQAGDYSFLEKND